ncbi:MAG TPA: class I SAM-dependent methyltransferase, partial [Oligoflexia bacterium]|nr:class I SAM-dependent methyltransferase [Oligoflexia bacterium]
GYDVFLKRTNFRDQVEIAVGNYIEAKFHRFVGPSGSTRILEIGCGNGEMTVRYLRELRNVLQSVAPKVAANFKIRIDLVEPAQGALNEAVRAIKELDPNIEVRAFAETMDAFKENAAFRDSEYDWMIGSYVFYHVSPTIIPGLLEKLSPLGTFMVAMGSPQHPLRAPAPLKALSKHGDSNAVASVLDSSAVRSKFGVELLNVDTEVDLKGLWNQSTGATTDGTAYFSFIYNHDLQRFNNEERAALDGLLTNIFNEQGGKIHPQHHLFWVWRK